MVKPSVSPPVPDVRVEFAVAVGEDEVEVERATPVLLSDKERKHALVRTDELAVGHYYKRLSQLEAMFGDAEYYLNALAAA